MTTTAMANQTIHAFLRDLGSKTPTPGGGAVAAITGATAAALARMVVSYSLGKKNLAEHQPALEQAAAALDRARDVFLELADEDAAGYAVLNDLQKRPDADARKAAEMPAAVQAAVQIPLACAAAACDLLRSCESLVTRTNRFLRSDLAIAAVLAEGAVASACWNVRVNAPMLPESARGTLTDQVDRLLRDAVTRRAAVESGCA
ncbi:MAG: cyclodeaminase/cyclohydrolase family protein [Phycisphaerales bacterium]